MYNALVCSCYQASLTVVWMYIYSSMNLISALLLHIYFLNLEIIGTKFEFFLILRSIKQM
jgi:hypothetical protein